MNGDPAVEDEVLVEAPPAPVFRYAKIGDGVVLNVVLASEDVADERGWVLIPEGEPVSIGWLYDGEGFSEGALPPPVPEFVTRAQAKIALARAGYYEQAAALIAQAGLEAQIWWSEAETFRFDHPLVDLMCAQMTPPISPEAKAELFINAEKIA